MASLSDEEQQLIQRDREENPGTVSDGRAQPLQRSAHVSAALKCCFYSTALSQSCRSINGDSKCEIIKKIFRQCPGRSKELISNRKEVTEDEHGGELSAGDFFNRERMDPKKREDDFEAQMSPFDFFRQELLRPFEGLFGGGLGGFGGGDDRGGFGSLFDQFEREFERMPQTPQPVQPPSHSRRPAPPPNPPHYSFQPSKEPRAKDSDAKARADEKRDIFEGYTGRVEEI